MLDPPVDAANHPLNVYPLRVGSPGDALIEPPVVVEPSLTDDPPCSSYDTVKELAVHTA